MFDSNTDLEDGGSCGVFKACGSANKRDFRRRFAVGEIRAVAILTQCHDAMELNGDRARKVDRLTGHAARPTTET